MNDETPAFQTIVIDHPDTVAVFVDPTDADDRPTRVFYDLDALFNLYAQNVMAKGLQAKVTGDENLMNAVRGQTILLEGIRQSIEVLRLDYEFDAGTAEKPADPLGFTGEDGTLS